MVVNDTPILESSTTMEGQEEDSNVLMRNEQHRVTLSQSYFKQRFKRYDESLARICGCMSREDDRTLVDDGPLEQERDDVLVVLSSIQIVDLVRIEAVICFV